MSHKKMTNQVVIGVGVVGGAVLAFGMIPMIGAAEATADDAGGAVAAAVVEPGPIIEPGPIVVGPGGVISDILFMPINLIDNTITGISSTVSDLLSLEFGSALDSVVSTIQGDIDILLSPFFDISGGVIDL